MKWTTILASAAALLAAQATAATIVDADDIIAADDANGPGAAAVTIGDVTVTAFNDFGLPSQSVAEFQNRNASGSNPSEAGISGGVSRQIAVLSGPNNGDPARVQAMQFDFSTPQDLESIEIARLFPITPGGDRINESADILITNANGTSVVRVESLPTNLAITTVDGLGTSGVTSTIQNAGTQRFLVEFNDAPIFDGVTRMVLLPGSAAGPGFDGSDYSFVTLSGAPSPDPIPLPGAAVLFAGGLGLLRLRRRG